MGAGVDPALPLVGRRATQNPPAPYGRSFPQQKVEHLLVEMVRIGQVHAMCRPGYDKVSCLGNNLLQPGNPASVAFGAVFATYQQQGVFHSFQQSWVHTALKVGQLR